MKVVTYRLSESFRLCSSEIKERALRTVGKEGYSLFFQNCEHFVTWCVYGNAESGNVMAAAIGTTTTSTSTAGLAGNECSHVIDSCCLAPRNKARAPNSK